VFTNDEYLAKWIRSLRVHGQSDRYMHAHIGLAARLDTMQAAILLAKLPRYPHEITLRQEVAEQYTHLLADYVTTPTVLSDRTSVWAQYSVQAVARDALCEHLNRAGIPTAIHYPRPLHLQECFAYLEYRSGDFPVAEEVSAKIFSLPMNPFVTVKEQKYIAQAIAQF
jgi:UDP-2-acetamido-2-deoxy-ribo-hexuluronate aminotransferase